MSFIYILIGYLVNYIPNLTGYVFGGDSAEIVSALSNFGIPHPPGYPLLAFLGNFFVRIFPIGNVYQKLSLLNSFFILLTSCVIFLTFKLIIKKDFISLFGSFFFMVLFPVWLYGAVPEVFSLAIFLISIQIYSLISLYLYPKNRAYLYKNIFLLSLGLSIAHHHIFVFFIPGYFWLIYKTSSMKKLFLKNKLKNIFFAFIGVIFYLYPVIVSVLNTPLDIENAKTLQGFLDLITRASYGTFKAYSWAGSDLSNRLYDIFSALIFIIQDFRPLGILFILLGGFYLYKRHSKIMFFFLTHLIFICFFYFYSNFYLNNLFGVATYERFLVFLYMVLIFYFGIGIMYFYEIYLLFLKKYLQNHILYRISLLIFYSCLLGFLLITYSANYKIIKNLKNLKVFENFGQDILKTPTKNSILILKSDNSFFVTQNLYFVQLVRPDLTIITLSYLDRPYLQTKSNINKKIIFPTKSYSLNESRNSYFYKINYSQGINVFSEQPYSDGVWIPYGLLWKYYPDLETFNKERMTLVKTNQDLWTSYQFPQISSDVSNILFTEDIKLFYGRQIWATINYYIINNQLDTADTFAQKYYSKLKDDYHYLLTYIGLNVFKNQCNPRVKSSVEKILKFGFQQSIDYTPILGYYQICENNPKEYLRLKNESIKLKQNEDVSLDRL